MSSLPKSRIWPLNERAQLLLFARRAAPGRASPPARKGHKKVDLAFAFPLIAGRRRVAYVGGWRQVLPHLFRLSLTLASALVSSPIKLT